MTERGPGNKRKAGNPPIAHRFKPGQSGNPSGRPKKTVEWKDAEDALREAIPRLLLMEQNQVKLLLQSNPTGAEVLAARFLAESPAKAVERFLGKMPLPLTGAEGKPLMPTPPAVPEAIAALTNDLLLKLIEATK